MRTLDKLTVRNFKSIRDQTLELGRLNLFIGGNGAGKSNLVGVFKFLNRVVSDELQTYTGQCGGANSLLHFGRKQSPSLFVSAEFTEGNTANGYAFELLPTAKDSFVFGKEEIWFHDRKAHPHKPFDEQLGSGQVEARLPKADVRIAPSVRRDLASYRIYHFHDTSPEAKLKQTGKVDENRILFPDAGNLAAFLFRLKQTAPTYYANIEDAVRQIAPFFDGFRLVPSALNPNAIQLEWAEKNYEGTFNAAALSDGTLRFICLATLLLQPEPPGVILLDEPELGLHPAAIGLLSDMLEAAATRAQVVVATQSVTLVNQFTPQEVWVVERENGASVFKHLKSEDLSAWVEGYSLGELWEKNVIGGRP